VRREFEDVSFRYAAAVPLIDGMSLISRLGG